MRSAAGARLNVIRATVFFIVVVVLILVWPLSLSAQSTGRKKPPNVELHLSAGELVAGVPETFTFTFENVSDHEVRLPAMTPCIPGKYVARIKLNLDFTPLHPPLTGGGGGCGGGVSPQPNLLTK